MNITDWNAIADAYSEIDDPEGRTVLTFVREKLTTLRPKRLLDYGGGDGKFAVLCAESLPLQEVVTFDPAPRMTSLARSLCVDFKQIHVTDAIQDRILRGSKVSLAFNSSGSGSVGANILAYGNLKVKVTYDGKSSFVETGKGIPLVFQTHIFKLTGEANNPEFRLLTGPEATQFNFQKAIKREQF